MRTMGDLFGGHRISSSFDGNKADQAAGAAIMGNICRGFTDVCGT
jgi:hypothetical protein